MSTRLHHVRDRGTGELHFDELLKLDAVAAQLTAGDLSKEVIEALWLEAVSKPGAIKRRKTAFSLVLCPSDVLASVCKPFP